MWSETYGADACILCMWTPEGVSEVTFDPNTPYCDSHYQQVIWDWDAGFNRDNTACLFMIARSKDWKWTNEHFIIAGELQSAKSYNVFVKALCD